MKKYYSNSLLVFFIFSILTALSYFHYKDMKKEYVNETIYSQCDIQKIDCIIKTKYLSISIAADEDVYYLKPFNMEVEVTSKEKAESIYIDFKMKNMNMGVNRFKLIKNKNKIWQGKALLPICVSGRADWFTEIEIIVKNIKYLFIFPLKVKQAPV